MTFTCQTQGSPAIAWQSVVYIGAGNRQLVFSTNSNIGDTDNSTVNRKTFAKLILKNLNNTSAVLGSQLHVDASSPLQSVSVVCIHTGNQVNQTINFQVLGELINVIS